MKQFSFVFSNTDNTYATLEQFVDFITLNKWDPDANQEHWKPVESYCNPCTIDYDVIMHTDTLDEDMR